MTSVVLTVPQVAEALSISRWSVYELIKRNELRAVHVGRALRVPRVVLEEFLGTNESQSDG